MKPQNEPQKFNRYLHYAEKAALAEKQGNYAEAKDHWEIAELSAKSVETRKWAASRAQFCSRMHTKPF